MKLLWTSIGLLAAAIAASASAEFERLPPKAVWLLPARTALIPDVATLHVGESRMIRQGERLFAFTLDPPPAARISGPATFPLKGQQMQVEKGAIFMPFTPLLQSSKDPVTVYCSPSGSAASALAKAALRGTGADKASLCLLDEDHNGSFDKALLDAVFPTGVVPAIARDPVSISPLPYDHQARSDASVAGAYELYFRGFPIQGDRLTVGLRRRDTKNSRPIANLLMNSGSGYVNYYTPYSFVRYDPLRPTKVEVMGAAMTITDVDRKNAVMHVVASSAQPAAVFTVFDYGKYVPSFHDFDGGKAP